MATADAGRAGKGPSQAPAHSARPLRGRGTASAGSSSELEKFACGQPRERVYDRLFRRT